MHGKHGGRALLESRLGAERTKRLIYGIIAAEVLAEELGKRRAPTRSRLDISTAGKRIAILEELIPLLSENEWQHVDEVIRLRIRHWNEDERKRSRS
jgi:hypothetical protein